MFGFMKKGIAFSAKFYAKLLGMPFADEVQSCMWHTREIGVHTFT